MVNRVRTLAVLAAVSAALTTAAGGFAVSNGGGNSAAAPGQQNAAENCTAAIARQDARGIAAGGGPKDGIGGPADCDHNYR